MHIMTQMVAQELAPLRYVVRRKVTGNTMEDTARSTGYVEEMKARGAHGMSRSGSAVESNAPGGRTRREGHPRLV